MAAIFSIVNKKERRKNLLSDNILCICTPYTILYTPYIHITGFSKAIGCLLIKRGFNHKKVYNPKDQECTKYLISLSSFQIQIHYFKVQVIKTNFISIFF